MASCGPKQVADVQAGPSLSVDWSPLAAGQVFVEIPQEENRCPDGARIISSTFLLDILRV